MTADGSFSDILEQGLRIECSLAGLTTDVKNVNTTLNKFEEQYRKENDLTKETLVVYGEAAAVGLRGMDKIDKNQERLHAKVDALRAEAQQNYGQLREEVKQAGKNQPPIYVLPQTLAPPAPVPQVPPQLPERIGWGLGIGIGIAALAMGITAYYITRKGWEVHDQMHAAEQQTLQQYRDEVKNAAGREKRELQRQFRGMQRKQDGTYNRISQDMQKTAGMTRTLNERVEGVETSLGAVNNNLEKVIDDMGNTKEMIKGTNGLILDLQQKYDAEKKELMRQNSVQPKQSSLFVPKGTSAHYWGDITVTEGTVKEIPVLKFDFLNLDNEGEVIGIKLPSEDAQIAYALVRPEHIDEKIGNGKVKFKSSHLRLQINRKEGEITGEVVYGTERLTSEALPMLPEVLDKSGGRK